MLSPLPRRRATRRVSHGRHDSSLQAPSAVEIERDCIRVGERWHRGLAVVGSRDAGHADLAFAAKLGAQASRQGISIVSGGARGIDEAAMLGALENEGTAIGVLADSLLRAAISAKYRKHLMTGNLALVSPYNPEAGFDVGNAMARNRYIYCLGDGAVVVSSSRNTGGTWTGAIENLKEGWVPLWVKPGSEGTSGNVDLVRRGARWLPDVEHESRLPIDLGTSEGILEWWL